MWGRNLGGDPRLLPLLLLLLPAAVGLWCPSCGAGTQNCTGAPRILCPPSDDVCAEASVAVAWSHGRLALWGRGCSRGSGGSQARALPLGGVLGFLRRRNRNRNQNQELDQELELETLPSPPSNASEQAANGLRCYGCHDDGPCPPLRVVECYGAQRGCFHGNVSLTIGGVTAWRELRGCAQEASCGGEALGDDVVTLRGSCCAGDLCNGPPPNQTFFDPDWPRLELLPHGHAPTTTTAATPHATKMADGVTGAEGNPREGGNGTDKMAAGRARVAPGVGVGLNGSRGGAGGEGKMAATGANMAAGSYGVDRGTEGRREEATATAKMAAGGDKMAATQPNMAAEVNADVIGVTVGVTRGSGGQTKMAAGDKMAAGRAAKGGGARRWAGPGWLLPLLLLALL